MAGGGHRTPGGGRPPLGSRPLGLPRGLVLYWQGAMKDQPPPRPLDLIPFPEIKDTERISIMLNLLPLRGRVSMEETD